jgi:hypothetical protein
MVHNISFQLNNLESNHSKLLKLQIELGSMRRKLAEHENISPSQKHHFEIKIHKLELEIKKHSTLLKNQAETLNNKFKNAIPNLENDQPLIFSKEKKKIKTNKHRVKSPSTDISHKRITKP